MAWQLVYTSAPALIEAGRSGFGTVARPEAIRPALQTELERISQFSREQGLSKNRILFYHRVLDLRGERYHVLSRIKDAGSDYTGRTNHIAHHIVLTAAEAEQCYRTTRCSPADMILWVTSNGLWRDQWNESARLFDSTEEIAVGAIPARLSLPAVSWGSVTGAAANAAILAPGGAATEGCWLLYREDQSAEVLPLIGEALCLHSNPWAISFSTDTQPTDRIEEIQWRGVALGSPLERTALQSVRPVLDLGNPTSLPLPVDAFAHLAETGLRKAPEPASARGKLLPKTMGTPGQRMAVATYSTGSSMQASPKGGAVSLRDRMKSSGPSAKENKGNGHSLSWIVIGAAAVLFVLLAVFIGNQCVIDEVKLNKLVGDTRKISNNIGDLISKQDQGARKIDESWKEVLVSQSILIDGYRIVPFGFKTEFNEAKEKIDNLCSKTNEDLKKSFDFLSKTKNEKNQLLSKIIDKINEVKASAEDRAKEEKQKSDAEQQRLVEENAKQEQEAAETRKINEEAKVASQAVMNPTPSPTPSPQKIVRIEFMEFPQEISFDDKFFPKKKIIKNAVSWIKKNDPSSILAAFQEIQQTKEWQTDAPNEITKINFNESFINSSVSVFAVKDTNNQITEFVIFKKTPIETQDINSGAFVADQSPQGDYVLSARPQITSFIKTCVDSGIRSEYSIIKNGETHVLDKEPLSDDSLVELEKKINKRLQAANEENNVLKTSKPSFKNTPEPLDKDAETVKKQLYEFGPQLFSGVMTKDSNAPAFISSYPDWMQSNNKQDQMEYFWWYKKYLIYVFGFIDQKMGSSNSCQYTTFSYLKAAQILLPSNKGDKDQIIKYCFDKMLREKCDDFRNKLNNTSTYSTGSDTQKNNDKKFIDNLSALFSLDQKLVKKIFPNLDPPPDPEGDRREAERKLKNITAILDDLQKGKLKTYKSRIKLIQGSNELIIFTSP